MMFLTLSQQRVEHGSEKQAFLLSRKIDKYLYQADNELQTTTSQLNRVTLSFDESNDLLSSIKAFGDVTVSKIIDHTIHILFSIFQYSLVRLSNTSQLLLAIRK
jgi:hypothetical protein